MNGFKNAILLVTNYAQLRLKDARHAQVKQVLH